MRHIDRIYWHHSDSPFGDDDEIGWWHKCRGMVNNFRGKYDINTAYHFIVLNGNISSGRGEELECLDGSIEVGRRVEQRGAGVRGDNSTSIHICLIGKEEFSQKQIQVALKLTRELQDKYGIAKEYVLGHYEYWLHRSQKPLKTCPGIDMERIRSRL